jgi:hypothetical protein
MLALDAPECQYSTAEDAALRHTQKAEASHALWQIHMFSFDPDTHARTLQLPFASHTTVLMRMLSVVSQLIGCGIRIMTASWDDARALLHHSL